MSDPQDSAPSQYPPNMPKRSSIHARRDGSYGGLETPGSSSGLGRSAEPPSVPVDDFFETTGMQSRRFTQERRKSRRRIIMKRIRSVIILLLVLTLVAGAGYFAVRQLTNSDSAGSVETDDFPGPGSGSVTITIEEGESGTQIGQSLVDAGVVKSLSAFIRAFEANKAASSIRPGTYELQREMSASGAVAALLDEKNRTENTVTVNPGQTVAQVVERITQVTDFTTEDVEAALKDTQGLGLPAQAGGNVEGWLYPGSYEVSSSDTPTTLLSEMIENTVDELNELNIPEDQWETVLNKASILEREVNIDRYLPMVARVIENRLADTEGETRGYLQMDSTVLYGVGKSGGIPTREDLLNDNPYNTYLYPNLPPGPIAQPSRAAIEAVLNPADGNWLYYVTVNLDTGETLFSATSEEQVENTKLFTAYCEQNPGKC